MGCDSDGQKGKGMKISDILNNPWAARGDAVIGAIGRKTHVRLTASQDAIIRTLAQMQPDDAGSIKGKWGGVSVTLFDRPQCKECAAIMSICIDGTYVAKDMYSECAEMLMLGLAKALPKAEEELRVFAIGVKA
jgi:hypothetical protein